MTIDSAVTLNSADIEMDDRFATLYATQFGPLVRFARTRLASRADAEDIVQDSFGSLWRRWETVAQPSDYLWASVGNGCRDDLRRAQLRRRYDLLLFDRPVDDQEYLTDLVATLSAPRQQVLIRRFYRGETLREIAEATDQPIGTVKSSLHRALGDLRQSLRRANQNESES